jgi:hypothetical protein
MFEYFYNHNLRKLVVGFGSLFSNIQVAHTDSDTGTSTNIRVPIHYAPQEKFIQRLLQPSSITPGTRIELQVPVISFMMNSVTSDPGRRLPRIGIAPGCSFSDTSSKIPVNVSFNLFVYTRHTDDMLQAVEQIMPYFVPDHIISMNMNSAETDVQIPIIMVSNNLSERYEGDLSSRRLNIASFQFMAKSWIFGEVKTNTTIGNINTSGTDIIFD